VFRPPAGLSFNARRDRDTKDAADPWHRLIKFAAPHKWTLVLGVLLMAASTSASLPVTLPSHR
jgi:hypothetical protein